MKNWMEIEAHPSDTLVHWSERRDARYAKEFKKRILALRSAWDLTHSSEELSEATDLIVEWAVNYALSDKEAELQYHY